MPFINPFDPTTPTDANLASEGDDRIREIKAALIERLATLINGWPDTDPLTLKVAALDAAPADMATIKTGTLATRPAVPDSSFYWATDTDALYVAEAGAWVQVSPPTAASNVSHSQMKGGRLQFTTATVSVPNNTGSNFYSGGDPFLHIVGGGQGISGNTHAVLALKYRIRNPPIAHKTTYAQFTSRHLADTNGANTWVQNYERASNGAGGLLNLGVLITKFTVEDGIFIEGRYHNWSGGALDAEIQYDIWLLKDA